MSLGDRMKQYERVEAMRCLMPKLPTLIRLDGKAFHTFTKGLARPYDIRLSNLMIDTTKFLVGECNAIIGYTQSDEITLILYGDELYLKGRVQKLCSVLSSMCTAYFNSRLPTVISERGDRLALFDCRVWNVPTMEEAVNALVWRELDATKNAVSMAASTYFSPRALHGKRAPEMQEMLFQKEGINFNDYPVFFKRGSYIRRVATVVHYSPEELNLLPLKHEARDKPGEGIEQTSVEVIDMPCITSICNRVDVIFHGAEPIIHTSQV